MCVKQHAISEKPALFFFSLLNYLSEIIERFHVFVNLKRFIVSVGNILLQHNTPRVNDKICSLVLLDTTRFGFVLERKLSRLSIKALQI